MGAVPTLAVLWLGVVAGIGVGQRHGAASAPAQQPQEPKPPPGGEQVTRLVYDLSHEELDRVLVQRPGVQPEDLLADVIAVVQRRLGDAAKVQRVRGTMFEVLAPGSDEAVRGLRARIEQDGRLEMRVVATEDFEQDGVSFDLTRERARLRMWLLVYRDLVRGNPKEIDRFNFDAVYGPLAWMKDRRGADVPALRWYPHLIKPSVEHETLWDRPFSHDTQPVDGVSPLGGSTIAVFDEITEWNGGKVPDAMLAAAKADPKKAPVLVEFVAINMKERSFSGADLDPRYVVFHDADDRNADDGRFGVSYSLKPEQAADYANWSGKYIKKHSAIILDGCVRAAPYFITRIPGRGQISGGFTKEELKALASCLFSGEMPVPPVLLRTEQVTAPK